MCIVCVLPLNVRVPSGCRASFHSSKTCLRLNADTKLPTGMWVYIVVCLYMSALWWPGSLSADMGSSQMQMLLSVFRMGMQHSSGQGDGVNSAADWDANFVCVLLLFSFQLHLQACCTSVSLTYPTTASVTSSMVCWRISTSYGSSRWRTTRGSATTTSTTWSTGSSTTPESSTAASSALSRRSSGVGV